MSLTSLHGRLKNCMQPIQLMNWCAAVSDTFMLLLLLFFFSNHILAKPQKKATRSCVKCDYTVKQRISHSEPSTV